MTWHACLCVPVLYASKRTADLRFLNNMTSYDVACVILCTGTLRGGHMRKKAYGDFVDNHDGRDRYKDRDRSEETHSPRHPSRSGLSSADFNVIL
jgi:hypothetical protein